jgi:glycosyltransferase involved in cell wall biosynthesis
MVEWLTHTSQIRAERKRFVKLIIQVPAYNEAETIADLLNDLPTAIPGVDSIEVLIIDDGCSDNTASIALQHRLHSVTVVRHTSNKGLATAYQTGIDAALRLGADIIVNTDGDGQYPGYEIPRLIEPILEGRADFVIGDRQTKAIEHFSFQKKILQQVGSWVVRLASDTNVGDTVSGFRALNREAALRTFVTTDFSYTIENLIQAGKRRLSITTIPISVRPTRPSRLHKGNWHFVKRQAAIIARTYATYEPLKTFSYIAICFFVLAMGFLGRATYVFIGRRLNWFSASLSNDQSLLIGGIVLVLAVFTFLMGLLADRIGSNRRMMEEILYRVRSQEMKENEWRRKIDQYLVTNNDYSEPQAPSQLASHERITAELVEHDGLKHERS